MRCEVVGRSEDSVSFDMVFDSAVFEKAVVNSYRERHPENVKRADLMMLSTNAVLERCDDATDVVRDAVQGLFAAHCEEAFARLGLVPGSRVEMRPLSSELSEGLTLRARVVDALELEDMCYEGIVVSYDEILIEGTEVDRKMEVERSRYGVRTDEELLEKTKAYRSVTEMRDAVSESLKRYVDQANAAARREAVAKALVEQNPVAVSDDEMNAFVDGEIQKLKDQIGSDSFTQQGFDAESLRDTVRRDVGHLPALHRILDVIAAQMHFGVTDTDRRKEIETLRSQSVKPDRFESVEETLHALEGEPQIRTSLDRSAKRTKALDYVVSRAHFKRRAYLTLSEAIPAYLNQQQF